MVCREVVGFFFLVGVGSVPLQKPLFLAVQEDMPAFMKEREPEMVIGFVSAAELDHRLIRRDPPRRAANMRMSQLACEAHCDAVFSTIVLQRSFYPLQVRFSCERAQAIQERPEPSAVIRRALHALSLKLTEAQPGA